jgi:hypothetical protein
MRKTGLKAMLFVRVLCAVSLLMLGLVHQAPVAFAASPAYDAAAYQLPDGTRASLCVTINDSDGKALAFKANCEACRLSASVMLPSPQDSAWLHRGFAALDNPLGEFSAIRGTSAVARPNSRAPPVLL